MHRIAIIILIFTSVACFGQGKIGANITWTTYEAEKMKTNGIVMGPAYTPFRVETESSGQKCVKLPSKGGYVEFTASGNANCIVIRYSLPDKKEGGGKHSTLGIYKNGKL